MSRAQSVPTVKKQLLAVADKLEDVRVTGARRLALLRKQAELGDARDAAADKVRRAQNDANR